MDETNRFLRYVIPGVVCLTEFTLLTLLAIPAPTIEVLKEICDSNAKGFLVLLGLLISSGGLGFIFSQMYFAIIMGIRNCWFRSDMRPVIRRLHETRWRGEPLLRLRSPFYGGFFEDIGNDRVNRISKEDAWQITWQLFEAGGLDQEYSDRALVTINMLTSMLHTLGAVIVGTFISMFLWLYIVIVQCTGDACDYLLVLLLHQPIPSGTLPIFAFSPMIGVHFVINWRVGIASIGWVLLLICFGVIFRMILNNHQGFQSGALARMVVRHPERAFAYLADENR